MTDHPEVRRDAERFTDRDIADFTCHQGMSFVMTEDYDALLAELEQAEREREEAQRGIVRLNGTLIEDQARLASVPALVEALRYIGDESHAMPPTAEGMRKRARAALTVYEQSQGKP